MSLLTVGIIGLGRIGKLHAENILNYIPQMKLKTVTDLYLDEKWVKMHHISNFGHEPDLILSDPDIEAVLICSPSPTHAPLIIAAAKAKKHIFCEKPISLDVNAIHKALSVVGDAGVTLQVGFNRRFDPQFVKARQAICDGSIGKPHMFRLTFRDPEPPSLDYVKQSGGIFLDMSIHDFDMARFLSGEEITEVHAMGATLINPKFADYDDVDTAVIQLKFASGALGVIDNSRKAVYGYDQRVEVFGDQGCIITENITPTRTVLSSADAVYTDKPLYFFLDRYQESYRDELKSFCHSVTNNIPSLVGGKDGLMPVVIGLAAKQSLKEKRPITI